MIRKVKFKDLDFSQYTECIRKSVQYNFYSEIDFLKSTGFQWEFLIYNDYQAVMPIPIIKKLGIKIVVAPNFAQQLGIFSSEKNEILELIFLKFFKKKYRIWFYPFNKHNALNLPKRRNYKIFRNDYASVRQNYSPNRRRNTKLNEIQNEDFHYEISNLSEIKPFFYQHIIGFDNLKAKKNYYKTLETMEQLKVLEIHSLKKHHQLISVAILGKNKNENVLFCFINDKKKAQNLSTLLIDHILRNSIEEKTFNFFGSNIPSVANFYERFGAAAEEYPYIKNPKWKLFF